MKNFLYFEGMNVVEEAMKVWTTLIYISNIAALWWDRKHDEIAKGACEIDNWTSLKRVKEAILLRECHL